LIAPLSERQARRADESQPCDGEEAQRRMRFESSEQPTLEA